MPYIAVLGLFLFVVHTYKQVVEGNPAPKFKDYDFQCLYRWTLLGSVIGASALIASLCVLGLVEAAKASINITEIYKGIEKSVPFFWIIHLWVRCLTPATKFTS